MANKSLTDLTARTATADSDLIHVNSGGTDYKETKANFLKGDFLHSFNNTSTLTSQVDALSTGTYFGGISGYGKQTETGLPVNANCYVKAQKYTSSTYSVIEIWSINNAQEQHWIIFKNNGTWGSWEHVPARSEISSLNNSLTQSLLSSVTKHASISSVIRSPYSVVGNVVVGSVVFVVGSSAIPTSSVLLTLNDLPGKFRATYDLYAFWANGGTMCYADGGTKNIKANGTIAANATVFLTIVGSIS